MADLLLDPVTHDMVYSNGETPLTSDRNLTVAQRLKIKLQTFKGEWFLDTTIGIPYFQVIFQRGVSKATIDTIYQEAILSEPDVVSIVEFNSIIDTTTSTYQMSFKVKTNENFITDYIDITQGA